MQPGFIIVLKKKTNRQTRGNLFFLNTAGYGWAS